MNKADCEAKIKAFFVVEGIILPVRLSTTWIDQFLNWIKPIKIFIGIPAWWEPDT